ncbi:L-threonylcarbamoyladenylate synthase [Candidatus Paracaedibacter symbiosus]|uniref:L-threonylcarbamoyladenylate synthase n=1 Tax=Candidatus Paracaedibacter symbiosus TaxID=244582 RepID=UPI000509F392|nr:L-threonylcarbamoyladenylate synthase [Candidatus Paracaedibacter symbiosus]
MTIKQLTSAIIEAACDLWRRGDIVAIPTETVYGLAADAEQDAAVAKIFTVKGRPQFNPLILHVSSLEQLADYVEVTPLLTKAAAAFWPGPLTLVLKRKSGAKLSYLVTAGLDSVAVRLPAHPIAQELIQAYGKPLAAPSANKSNSISPTSAEDVAASLGNDVPLIIDGGQTRIGLESTIVDLTSETSTILRPGGVTFEDLNKVFGQMRYAEVGAAITAPGMLKRHYAPSIPMRLNVLEKQANEVMLGFGNVEGDLNLSEQGDLGEAAANLFRMMRLLDNPVNRAIAVAPIPYWGLGIAINDRLSRAATREI